MTSQREDNHYIYLMFKAPFNIEADHFLIRFFLYTRKKADDSHELSALSFLFLHENIYCGYSLEVPQ